MSMHSEMYYHYPLEFSIADAYFSLLRLVNDAKKYDSRSVVRWQKLVTCLEGMYVEYTTEEVKNIMEAINEKIGTECDCMDLYANAFKFRRVWQDAMLGRIARVLMVVQNEAYYNTNTQAVEERSREVTGMLTNLMSPAMRKFVESGVRETNLLSLEEINQYLTDTKLALLDNTNEVEID